MSTNDLATSYLSGVLARVARNTGSTILFDDGEDYQEFPGTPQGASKAAKEAAEIDGPVTYGFKVDGRRAVINVLYDGPYNKDNCEEIIYDYSLKLEKFM